MEDQYIEKDGKLYLVPPHEEVQANDIVNDLLVEIENIKTNMSSISKEIGEKQDNLDLASSVLTKKLVQLDSFTKQFKDKVTVEIPLDIEEIPDTEAVTP